MIKPTNRDVSKYLKAYDKLKNHQGKEIYLEELTQLNQLAKGGIYEIAWFGYKFGYIAGYKNAKKKYKQD